MNWSEPNELQKRRLVLIEEFCRLPGEGDLLQWQRRLAAEHIASEQSDVSGTRREELKEHRRLLRLIGDNLAWALLPRHTLRSLGRHPGGSPAALAGQAKTMNLVWDVAENLRSDGLIPIIADLTNLIRIGDVVATNGANLVVLECKTQKPPASGKLSGRAGRQQERGERLEEYLQTSSVSWTGITVQAITSPELPEPDWAAVGDLIADSLGASDGLSHLSLGNNELLIAAVVERSDPRRVVEKFADSSGGVLFLPSELMDAPSFVARPPSAYPICAEHRWRLLERDISLFRTVPIENIQGGIRVARQEREAYRVI